MAELNQLSEFVAETTFEKLPEAVVERSKWVIRDSIGVIIAGMKEPEVLALAGYAAAKAPGPSILLGHGAAVLPSWAALVHGTAGTTLEMDEGHAFARGHAAVHSVPPALAMAQASGANGQALIAATVVGY